MASPDLADLAAFLTVARARSFRGAAKTSGASPSALSDAMRRLEARLGVRLLNRTTRSVTPTEAGQRLLERLGPMLDEVSAAVDSLNDFRGATRGTLRLNVPGVVADLVLPDILLRFMAAHPDIRVEVTADENFVDVLAGGFDAGVRYGEAIARDMIAIPIGPRVQRYVTAASPAYLKLHGTPKHPHDLLTHACIRFRFPSGVMPNWDFDNGRVQVSIAPTGPLVVSRIALQLAAAKNDVGVVHTFEGFLAPALKSRHIVPVLEDWSERFAGPFLYYASRTHMPGPLRAFVDFIKAERE